MMSAVVISLSKADHEYHTSKVNCLRLEWRNEEARPYGHPFQLTNLEGSSVMRNDFLRQEAIDVGEVIFVDPRNSCYMGNTVYHLVRL